MIEKIRLDLLEVYQAALARVDGRRCVREHLRQSGFDSPVSLVAIGKAAQAMALGAVDALGEQVRDGIVISKAGHLDWNLLSGCGLQGVEGGHPVPDERSLAAGEALLRFVRRQPGERRLLFLISGGASSLVEVLAEGIGLADLQRANRWLLGSGLDIAAINRLRRGLSRIKGGGLLHLLGERQVDALLISDVRDDNPAVIGSGLLLPPAGEGEEALTASIPPWLSSMLVQRKRGGGGRPTVKLEIIANLKDAKEEAAAKAEALGYRARLHRPFICGEAETVGRRCALELRDSRGEVLIWGGEPVVRLPTHPGRGGRCQHLALAAAEVLEGEKSCGLLAMGTDGTDGPGEDAGALVDGGTLGRVRREGLDVQAALRDADAGSLLEASGDLINTGPTGTNVMDLILGLRL
jgi:hydroxypyruvate reductase